MPRAAHSARARRRSCITRAAIVETLEFRRLLSVDVDVYGDTLVIKGDNRSNEIFVEEENGVVTVLTDGDEEVIDDRDIDKIIIKAGRGNDIIEVDLEDDDADLERVSIDGGHGNDEISLTIGEPLPQPGAARAPVAGDVNASATATAGAAAVTGERGENGRRDGRDDDDDRDEDDLEVDVTGGSGNDDINVQISLFRQGENGFPPFSSDHDRRDEDKDGDEDENDDVRGLELDIDGGSGNDTIDAVVVAVNFDETNFPEPAGEQPGADGGDGDGNIDIEIDGGSGHDDIGLQVVSVNAFGNVVRTTGSDHHRGGGGGGGGNEEDLEIDIDGGSGDDNIDVEINIINEPFLRVARSGNDDHNGDDAHQDARSDVDLDLDIDGGSGDDNIDVLVRTTPFRAGDFNNGNGITTSGIIRPGPIAFSDVEITIDGEAGDDNIAVEVLAQADLNNGPETAGVPAVGPVLPINIEVEGGSGDDELAVRIDANGAALANNEYSKDHHRDPFVKLLGDSGDDTLILIVLDVANLDELGDKAFLLHGGSGFDTCTTNLDDEDVKIISCEDHLEPVL